MTGVDKGTRSYQEMLGLITGFWVTQIMCAAVTLSVPDHLAIKPMTAEEISIAESSDPSATFRLLRACAALRLVNYEQENGQFTGTALLDTLRRDSPHSLRDLLLVQSAPGHWRSWGRFADSVRTGATQFESALGSSDIWAYFEQNPEEGQLFGAAMTNLSTPVIREAATVIDTTDIEWVADIGCANGAFLYELLALNPKLQGLLFDLPAALPGALADAHRLGLQDRSQMVAGNFFDSVPAADMYLVKYILHDWDDKSCVEILRSIRKAMRPRSRIIIVEMLVGATGDPGIGTLMDMNMLAMVSGKERDIREFELCSTRPAYGVKV